MDVDSDPVSGAPKVFRVEQLPGPQSTAWGSGGGISRPQIDLCWGLGNTLHVFVPGKPSGPPSAVPPTAQQQGQPQTLTFNFVAPGGPSPFSLGNSLANPFAQKPPAFSFGQPAPSPAVQAPAQSQGMGAEGGSLLALTWADTSAGARRVAALSAPLFAELQEYLQVAADARDRWESMVSWSGKISGAVLARFTSDPINPFDPSVHMLWDLLRICCLYGSRVAPSFIPAAPALATWLQAHGDCFAGRSAATVKRLNALRRQVQENQITAPEIFKDYWEVVASCAALGWVQHAVSLLRVHSSYRTMQHRGREAENGLVEAVAVLLSGMPLLKPPSPEAGQAGKGVDVLVLSPGEMHEFMQGRDRWRARLSKLDASPFWAECGNPSTERGLRVLVGVLLGSGEAIRHTVGSNWVELLVARLLHQHPQAGLDALSDLAQRARLVANAEGGSPLGEDGGSLDDLVQCIMEGEREEVLLRCSRRFTPWTMAHAIEIVSFDQVSSSLSREASLAESYRGNYALELLSHPATWQLSLPYLWSSESGMRHVETVLTWQGVQQRPSATKHLQPILSLATDYGVPGVNEFVAKALAQRSIEQGQLCSAFHWLSKPKEVLGVSGQRTGDLKGREGGAEMKQLVKGLLRSWEKAQQAGETVNLGVWCESYVGQAVACAMDLLGVDALREPESPLAPLARVWGAERDLQVVIQRSQQPQIQDEASKEAARRLSVFLIQALETAASFPSLFFYLIRLLLAAVVAGHQDFLSAPDASLVLTLLEEVSGKHKIADSSGTSIELARWTMNSYYSKSLMRS